MKFSMFSVMTLSVFGLILAGCTDHQSPIPTVQSAAYALSKNKVSQFRKLLTGKAAEVYSNDDEVGHLIATLKAYQISVPTEYKDADGSFYVQVLGTQQPNHQPALAPLNMIVQVVCIDKRYPVYNNDRVQPDIEGSIDCRIANIQY